VTGTQEALRDQKKPVSKDIKISREKKEELERQQQNKPERQKRTAKKPKFLSDNYV